MCSSEQHQLCALLLSFLDGVTVPDAKRSLRNRRRGEGTPTAWSQTLSYCSRCFLTVAPPNSGNRSQVYNPKGLLFFYEELREYIKHRCASPSQCSLLSPSADWMSWLGGWWASSAATSDPEVTSQPNNSWDRDTVWDLFWKLSS